eukprot:TRINITY_DN105887_c2_g1_i1.p1 TRINITY_DN105887_c2_g1~~TRINITY_DN105887_c2_g1_i1.p1  ORF type:complete len:675 (-),score=35.28 TRINITY_DN105887_c2_g1_i1:63-1925(-)
MKGSQGQKDKRKNYNSSKRGVNYVPKVQKAPESTANTASSLSNTSKSSEASGKEATTKPQSSTTPSYGRLTKPVILSLYIKRPVPTSVLDGIKALKEVYSEESILPTAFSEFTLPMNKAIMPPRKMPSYESKTSHNAYRDSRRPEDGYSENDQGIVTATDNSHSNYNNAPLWYDNDVASSKKLDPLKDDNDFSMEDLARRQISLEEEKARFMKGMEMDKKPVPTAKELGTKVYLESIFNKLGDEGEYSNVDVKYENSLKATTNKIATELFSDPAIESSADLKELNAIDAKSLEAEMLKGTKQSNLEEEEEGEEKPVWDAFSAEEIKQQSQKNMDNWGLTLDQTKNGVGANPDTFMSNEVTYNNHHINPAAIFRAKSPEELQPVRVENKNPFCHSSLNIKESDRVWYYKDIQNCIQGPFTSIEMYVWYKAGYFPHNLPLRCGEYAGFILLTDFLESVKPRPRPDPPVQHFDHSNMAMFFDPSFAPADHGKARATPAISLEELEGRFSPLSLGCVQSDPAPQQSRYYPKPIGRYPAPAASHYPSTTTYVRPPIVEDPAIASARLGATMEVNQPETGYITEEANDLKALLGMSGNSKPLYRQPHKGVSQLNVHRGIYVSIYAI